MSLPLKKSDPAYSLLLEGLKDPSKRTVSTVYDSECYICRDPEFALMGLPLCYACKFCGGHVPADDTICTECKQNTWEGSYPGESSDGAENLEDNQADSQLGVDVEADHAHFDGAGSASPSTPQALSTEEKWDRINFPTRRPIPL